MDYDMNYILNKFQHCDCFSLTSKEVISGIPKKDKKVVIDNYLSF